MDRIQSTPLMMLRDLSWLIFRGKIKNFVYGLQIDFMDLPEFEERLKNGDSLYRWGDGETAIFRGKSISYQKADAELSRKLMCLLHTDNLNIIHGWANVCTGRIWDSNWSWKKYKILLSTRIVFSQMHQKKAKKSYVDGHVWYPIFHRLPSILKTVSQNRPCVLIASNSEALNVCPSQTEFIQCRKVDAYDDYSLIVKQLTSWVSEKENQRPIIFVAAGPMSKALVFDFHQRCQVIDVGHAFDFHLKGARKYAWE